MPTKSKPTEPDRSHRKRPSPHTDAMGLIVQLDRLYQILFPGEPSESFRKWIFGVDYHSPQFDGDKLCALNHQRSTAREFVELDADMAEFLRRANQMVPTYASAHQILDFRVILIACAYCVQALRSNKPENRELAWSYSSDANYWTGRAIGQRGAEAVALAKYQFHQSKAGKGRHKNHQLTKAEATSFFLVNRHLYANKNIAAEAIVKHIHRLAAAQSNSPPPRVVETECDTIRGWLKGL